MQSKKDTACRQSRYFNHYKIEVLEVTLSIIVPVYNAEEYLTQCIESILKQSYRDIELILVDNNSTEECWKL